jgi:hypothetical protein
MTQAEGLVPLQLQRTNYNIYTQGPTKVVCTWLAYQEAWYAW